MKILLTLSLLAGYIVALTVFAADKHRDHGAHSHGLAQLNIALEGNALAIELDSPAANIVGFEHRPRTAEEHETLDAAMALLRKPELLFVTDTAAGCRPGHVEIHSGLEKTEKEGGHESHKENHEEAHAQHEHQEKHGEEHSDIGAYYELSCAYADKLKRIDVRLFKHFPATNSLSVQFISEDGQRAVRLDHDSAVFHLPEK